VGAYFNLRTTHAPTLFSQAFSQDSESKNALRAGKIVAKMIAASFEGNDREAAARTLTTAIVSAYWTSIQEGRRNAMELRDPFVPQQTIRLPNSAYTLASALGEAAGSLDPLAAAYLISVIYTAMLPDYLRSKLGAYYTPPPLADRLVSMASHAGVNWATCRVLDPACGGGAFLSAVAILILEAASGKSAAARLAEVETRLRGLEIDPYAAWLSQVFLEAAAMPVVQRAGRRLGVVVEVRDSLTAPDPMSKEGQYDLVVGNPPYGKISLPTDQRERYRRSLYGHANLYGLFTDLAIRLTRSGGIVAYVTPTSFLSGEYFKFLRALLLGTARPVNIDFVSVRKGVFDDALQETMLATYRKTGVFLHGPTVHFLSPNNDDTLTAVPGGNFDLPKGGGPWLLPRSPEQAQLISRVRSMPHRLKDYGYEVCTGPLVWNRHKTQLASKPGENVFPLIWAESVTSDGRFQFRAAKRDHKPYFKCKFGDDWLITRKPCVLLQRTTAKEQQSRLVAAELPAQFVREHGAVVIENHLNMIRPINSRPAVSAGVLAKLLNNPIVDQAFRCLSGSVAVSAYELESLPLPSPEMLLRLLAGSTSSVAIREACTLLYGPEGGL
jgi:adenine-specific DNA-methyltransferase